VARTSALLTAEIGKHRRSLLRRAVTLLAGIAVRTQRDRATVRIDRAAARLFEPADIRPLVYFRVAFGAIAFWEVCRYVHHGWIERTYIKPSYHFTYVGFGWVRPWPGNGMHLHFLGLGVTSLLVATGFWYRPAMLLFASGFTYVFLLEKAHYLNHFYLLSLVSWLMAILPANRAASIDAWRNPSLRAATVPTWTIWLLAGQIAVAYVFGGVAKINRDWLRGEPMRRWLADREDLPIIGRYVRREWMVKLFAYGGLVFDLFAVPLLLNRRSRPLALPLVAGFHVMNDRLFRIGIFPWFMLASTVLYLPPSWLPWPRAWSLPTPEPARPITLTSGQRLGAAALAGYALLQVLLPLRHFLYPGNVSWTEEGHRFAWHMKLRTKSGHALFHVTDLASGQHWTIKPAKNLTRRQRQRMATHPDMIVQFAHELARRFAEEGYPTVEVRAEVFASLNGRPNQRLIDPDVDLAKIRLLDLRPKSWIVPLTEPLAERRAPGRR
jgi:hypothetical protein